MQKLVDWIAPRGPVDFGLKLVFWLSLIGAMNHLRDVIEHPQDYDSFMQNTIEASFVALPFSVFALALVGHMQKLQRRLVELATTDLLTGLPNRGALLVAMEEARSKKDATFLMIDVDRFKVINDTYGHAVGDICLQAVANHLKGLCEETDSLGRLGGEEFGMVVRGRDNERLERLGLWIANGVAVTLDDVAERIKVTNSIGAVTLAAHVPISQSMRSADRALYAAKAAGRAQMLRYEDLLEHQTTDNLKALA